MSIINSPAAATASAASEVAHGRGSAPASYVTLRVVALVVGIFGATAASYFGFVWTAAEGGISNGFDLFVTLWKIGLSVAFVVAAIAPGLSRAGRVAVARWAMGAELVFDAIKLGYYRESAALVFTVIDCLLVALVLRAGRSVRDQ